MSLATIFHKKRKKEKKKENHCQSSLFSSVVVLVVFSRYTYFSSFSFLWILVLRVAAAVGLLLFSNSNELRLFFLTSVQPKPNRSMIRLLNPITQLLYSYMLKLFFFNLIELGNLASCIINLNVPLLSKFKHLGLLIVQWATWITSAIDDLCSFLCDFQAFSFNLFGDH